MPPKSKKQVRNAFYYFMAEYEKNSRKGGKPHPGGMRAISDLVSPIWQSMNAEQRRPYEERANADKGNHKYTTHGQTYEQVDEERRQQERKRQTMFDTIRKSVTGLNRNTELAKKTFFLIHMNYLCKTGDGTYYPAELALSAFSIEGGAKEPYFTLVNPGPLPSGYAYKARQHAEDTHRIDASRRLGEQDVVAMVAYMEQYVEEHNAMDTEPGLLPPFYTLEKFVPSIEEILVRWAAASSKPSTYFRIYVLEELFFELKKASLKPLAERQLIDGKPDEGFVYSTVAAKKLGDDPYSYKPRIACELHDELDVVQHCSRSYVIRWGWLMCDHLCIDMGVERIPGVHCPYDTSCVAKLVSKPQPLPSSSHRGFPPGHGRGSLEDPPFLDGLSISGTGAPRAMLPRSSAVSQGAIPRTGPRWNVPEAPRYQAPATVAASPPIQPGVSAWGSVDNQVQQDALSGAIPNDEPDFFPALSSRRRLKQRTGQPQAGDGPGV